MSAVSNDTIEKSIKTLEKGVQVSILAMERSMETLRSILKERKGEEEEERVKTERSEEEAEVEAPKETKRARKVPEVDPNFTCPGQIWSESAEPCVGGDSAQIPMGIRYNNKLHKICKDCKRVYDNKKKRENSQKKKEAAKE